jgi:hypothetical protein
MKMLKLAAVMMGALSLTLPALAPVEAAQGNHGGGKAHSRAGAPTAKAKPNVNRPKPSSSYQRPGQPNKVGNQGAKKGKNNVVAGNTVVVGRPPTGGGYYNNGNYHDRPDWDDDDDDFLEFVGKTAAVTAGVSAVAAVIGSVSNDKPDDCQPVNGYLYCNGTYYQPIQQNGQTAYQVVPPPPQ